MTFSMVARCPKTSTLGVCVASASLAVGSVVPHVEAKIGAIATQASTNILYGVNGLKLLKMGFSPEIALEAMLKGDLEREKRQVIIIDKNGNSAAFTGKAVIGWKGHLIGENYAVAGNMLVGSHVIKAMAETFENSRGELAERLIKALEAGQEAGGDKRGKNSAALWVAGKQLTSTRPFLEIRVDVHPKPIRELRRIFTTYKKWLKQDKQQSHN